MTCSMVGQRWLQQLRTFGIEWAAHPSEEEVRAEYDELRQHVGERPIETLVDQPSMRDADFLALMEVLLAILPAALFTERKIRDLAVLRIRRNEIKAISVFPGKANSVHLSD